MSIKVEGSIFQFDKDCVVFIFRYKDDDVFGIVWPSRVKLDSFGKRIPRSDLGTTKEALAKYIRIGDEISCYVDRDKRLKVFKYLEDEMDDVDNDDGLEMANSREIEIQPEWFAPQATIVRKRRDDEAAVDAEIGQVEKIDLVDIEREMSKDNDVTFVGSKNFFRDTATEEKDIPFVLAKVVALTKPSKDKKKSSKVSSGYMTVLEGQYVGKRVVFHASSLYVWGRHLKIANLMYNVKYGDEYKAQVVLNPNEQLSLKKAFMGNLDQEPHVSAIDHAKFANWLADRSLDEESFQKWIDDKLPMKLFFPLKSDFFNCKLEMLNIRCDPPYTTDCGLLTLCDADGETVFFDCDDFYVCGVSIGNFDIRLIFRLGDCARCQVQDMNNVQKKRAKKIFGDTFNIKKICSLVFVGEKIPKSAMLKPFESIELKSFLKIRSISIEEFERVRFSSSSVRVDEVEPIESNKTNHARFFQLISRVEKLKSDDDPEASSIITCETEVKEAFFLAKVLTNSLLTVMQTDVKNETLFTQRPLSADIHSELMANSHKNFAAQKDIGHPDESNITFNCVSLPINKSKSITIKQKLYEVERKMALEANSKKSSKENTGKAFISRNMKKMLESYKAQKSQGKRGSSTQSVPIKTNSRQNDQKLRRLSPNSFDRTKKQNSLDHYSNNSSDIKTQPSSFECIELLRHFTLNNKTIRLVDNEGDGGGMIAFDEMVFPMDTPTHFRVTSGRLESNVEYYNIYAIYFFLENVEKDHQLYSRLANEKRIQVIRRKDRANLLAYLTGDSDNVNQNSDVGSGTMTACRQENQDFQEHSSLGFSTAGDCALRKFAANFIHGDNYTNYHSSRRQSNSFNDGTSYPMPSKFNSYGGGISSSIEPRFDSGYDCQRLHYSDSLPDQLNYLYHSTR